MFCSLLGHWSYSHIYAHSSATDLMLIFCTNLLLITLSLILRSHLCSIFCYWSYAHLLLLISCLLFCYRFFDFSFFCQSFAHSFVIDLMIITLLWSYAYDLSFTTDLILITLLLIQCSFLGNSPAVIHLIHVCICVPVQLVYYYSPFDMMSLFCVHTLSLPIYQ